MEMATYKYYHGGENGPNSGSKTIYERRIPYMGRDIIVAQKMDKNGVSWTLVRGVEIQRNYTEKNTEFLSIKSIREMDDVKKVLEKYNFKGPINFN